MFLVSAGLDEVANPRCDGARRDRLPVLRVRDLRVYYHTPPARCKAVTASSFAFSAGERFGLVGESGSGKSHHGAGDHAHDQSARPDRGRARSASDDDRPARTLSETEMRRVRLARIALVPQGAMNSLNPVMRIARPDPGRRAFAPRRRAGRASDAGGAARRAAGLVGLRPRRGATCTRTS